MLILKKIPKFKSEDEERDFWATHCTTEYLDWSKAKRVKFTRLKRTPKSRLQKYAKNSINR